MFRHSSKLIFFSALPAISRQRRKIRIFCIFSSCTQTKDNFWKIYDVFLRQLVRLPANTIELFSCVPLPIVFMSELESFGVAPTSPTAVFRNLRKIGRGDFITTFPGVSSIYDSCRFLVQISAIIPTFIRY